MFNEEEARNCFESEYLNKAGRYAKRNEAGDYVNPAIQDAWSGWREAFHFLLTEEGKK